MLCKCLKNELGNNRFYYLVFTVVEFSSEIILYLTYLGNLCKVIKSEAPFATVVVSLAVGPSI